MAFVKSKGVLLTLGITFICLIVLSFATLILRNAENSDVRLTELSSIDRVYTLTSSLERGISRSYFPLTGINLTLNNNTITIVKDTKRQGSPSYYDPPESNDDQIFNMKTTDVFLNGLAKSLTYGSVTVDNFYGYNWPNILILSFYYPTYVNDLTKSFLFYAYSNDPSQVTKDYNFRHTQAGESVCCLFINNYSVYPVNTTYQMFFLGNSLSNLTEITISATHPTRCPIINWTDARLLSGTPAEGEVKVKMTVITNDQAGNCLPSDSRFKQIESDAILNRTSDNTIFSQILFLDNLTNDPTLQGYNFLHGESFSGASKERPTIFINGVNNTVETPITVGNNILYLLQYDNPIKWEVTLKYSVGPLEVYSTETVTASLSSLNVSRIHRPARFK
ncbi:hypothetical protein J4208_05330 [Candidatus Woesearchaeota archaeon]|nr:hypothetical protein [Candidatus Woesearchaeota archaeon]